MKTLFELSGAKKPNIDLVQSVLIIIDAQQEYETGKLPLARLKEATEVIQNILVQARMLSVPVVHVVHEGSKDGLFDPETSMSKVITGLEPQPGETVIVKKFPNSFAGTPLAQELQKMGKDRTLILVGFMTHMCVTATASAALEQGFQSAVVKDAVATRDLCGPDGKLISAESVNQISLAALKDRIAWIIDSQDLTSY